MQKWEYMIIVQAWNNIEQKFYWGDDMTDERSWTRGVGASIHFQFREAKRIL